MFRSLHGETGLGTHLLCEAFKCAISFALARLKSQKPPTKGSTSSVLCFPGQPAMPSRSAIPASPQRPFGAVTLKMCDCHSSVTCDPGGTHPALPNTWFFFLFLKQGLRTAPCTHKQQKSRIKSLPTRRTKPSLKPTVAAEFTAAGPDAPRVLGDLSCLTQKFGAQKLSYRTREISLQEFLWEILGLKCVRHQIR